MQTALALGGALVALAPRSVSGYDNTRNDNLAVYWGQNSYGATHTSDTANWQKTLSYYCQDDTVDAIPLAFLDVSNDVGGLPSIDFANICNVNDDTVFSGTDLPDCSSLATDVQTCQAAGKIVTISIGGESGAVSVSSSAEAVAFAQTIWNLFLGGSSDTRPLGDAVLDGVDLDLEGGSSTYWPDFVTELRSLMATGDKTYYITAAPQCPYPDAYVGPIINAVGFDAIYVQFYNNYCEVSEYTSGEWDFSDWDTWAKTVSPNPNVKVYLGAPASDTAATNGYVDAATLVSDALATRDLYSSFGGVMLWDASQAWANGNFAATIKSALSSGGSSVPTTTVASTTVASTTSTAASTTTTAPISTSSTSTAPTSTASATSCGAVAAWLSNVAYEGGSMVTYDGHLWTAKYWTEADVPGGASGDWTDDGPCADNVVNLAQIKTQKVYASIPATAVVNSAKSTATSKRSVEFARD